jgi:hypothetical protein
MSSFIKIKEWIDDDVDDDESFLHVFLLCEIQNQRNKLRADAPPLLLLLFYGLGGGVLFQFLSDQNIIIIDIFTVNLLSEHCGQQ